MTKKLFTPQEANKRLPLVRKIVEDILEKGKSIRVALAVHRGNDLPESTARLQDEVEALMGELEALGCYFKDWNFEIGLVDFPAVIDGEYVLLCWRSDEPNVLFYHPWEEGYAGRKPIPEHLLKEK